MIKTKVFEIALPKIKSAFEQMEHEAGWNTNERLYWGYYFLDHDKQRLERFSENLKKSGLEIIEIRGTENKLYLLHTGKHMVHSPESLLEECQNLARLAIDNQIEIFDGWDVEKEKLKE